MIRNNLKTAYRNLIRNSFYSILNLLGIAFGLTFGILIFLWVQDELSFDRFYPKAEHIYRVFTNMGTAAKKEIWTGVQAPVASWSKKQIPQVVNAVRIKDNYFYSLFKYHNKVFSQAKSGFVDPAFFPVFDIKVTSGNLKTLFQSPNSVVISKTTASKYFGSSNPIGKVILADNTTNLVVTGVMEDSPETSSIRYDLLMPMALNAKNFTGNGNWKTIEEDWGNYDCFTYILLKEGSSINTVEKAITKIHNQNQNGSSNTYILQPLTDLHLYNPDGSSSRLSTVATFIAIGIFILLIASINYINLSTSRSMLRFKEVSVRKIIGANSFQLFVQFLVETILVFIGATILSFVFIVILLPFYNSLTEKDLHLNIFDRHLWFVICTSIMVTLLAASIYPALQLASFKPVKSLKGQIAMGIGNRVLRKALVVTQFVFSIALITSTIIISKQLKFIHETELGFSKEHVFSIILKGDMPKHYPAIRIELMKQPSIIGVCGGDQNIIDIGSSSGDADWKGKDTKQSFIISQMGIDQHFIPNFGIKLVAGKNFSGLPADSSHFILNEAAVRDGYIKNPIGMQFIFHQNKGTIIGVAKDFHFASLKETIKPAIFYSHPEHTSYVYVKTSGAGAENALASTQQVWNKYSSGFPFEYNFLDETFDQLYKSDTRTGILFNLFAGITILISCIGLFGLATFTAQVKLKEIGIRKVLGASVSGIATLLTKDFIKLVLLAVFIAIPLAWYAMNNWLQEFAYRIHIGWLVFLVSGFIALLIAIITVSFQAVKAALANPITSIRSE